MAAGTEDRRLEYLPLDKLEAASRNPKRHDLVAVRASVERFGYASPALRDERTGRLVVGHGRTEVLRQMHAEGQASPAGVRTDKQGRWLVPVVCGWASRSDAEAEAYLVADNQHPALGGWDNAELAALLESVKADDPDLLATTGFDEDDLAQLLAGQAVPDLDDFRDPADTPHPTNDSGDQSPKDVTCPNCGEVFDPTASRT